MALTKCGIYELLAIIVEQEI